MTSYFDDPPASRGLSGPDRGYGRGDGRAGRAGDRGRDSDRSRGYGGDDQFDPFAGRASVHSGRGGRGHNGNRNGNRNGNGSGNGNGNGNGSLRSAGSASVRSAVGAAAARASAGWARIGGRATVGRASVRPADYDSGYGSDAGDGFDPFGEDVPAAGRASVPVASGRASVPIGPGG